MFKHVQRANTKNIVIVDDSPTKNLLNDLPNGLQPPFFQEENPSSLVDYLMIILAILAMHEEQGSPYMKLHNT